MIAVPTIVPSSVFGADAPSNRLVLGAIGVGGQGSGNLNGFLGRSDIQVVGICDVDRGHRERVNNVVDGRYGNKDCKTYLDFRELVGRGDLDIVSMATPDHWHALTAIAALKAGCDVYGEKPLSHDLREGRAICDAVHRYGRVWQTGSWQRCQGHFRKACELALNGHIGKVSKVEVGLPTGSATKNMPVTAVPDGLDWNLWVGPAPWRPFQGLILS